MEHFDLEQQKICSFVVCLFLHLWLLELQILSILYREVNVLQHDVHALLVCAVKRQESHHAVVINLHTDSDRYIDYKL